MKKRILFVDDEPLVLEGLRRMLRPLREQWQTEFAESGAVALAMMSDRHYDVVVADMRLPGMTGAELLNEVMKRYPRTVRLILSGQADTDVVYRCVGATHQYLSKPCDAAMLRATIERAARTESALKNDVLQSLVGRMSQLPSLPKVYVEILDLLRQTDCDVSDVGRVVEQDIAMTAQLLKLVNSAFFGLRRELSDATEAVSYLGVETVKTLVLSAHLFTEFKPAYVNGFSLEGLSYHSLATAAACRAIARFEECEPRFVEEAFCAGMLHDAGKLVLAQDFPVPYAKILEVAEQTSSPVFEVERQVLGADHADVGGYLLGLWGLPVPVVEAIALHHNPSQGSYPGLTSLLVVAVSNHIVKHLNQPPAPLEPEAELQKLLESTGHAEHLADWTRVASEAAIQGALA